MIAFGPISSRRLGKSLGINNIVSHKICSYSCIYCQIGNTTRKSVVRKKFYDPEKLVKHVESHLNKLDKNHKPDYLTFVANGEPTLDINLGREIQLLGKFGIPVAVITNASLIYQEEVREDLMMADWISVKIDTVDETVWKRTNRPVSGISLERILEGLELFAAGYKGKLHTETMLVKDYNDSTGQLKKSAAFIARLKPQKAYLLIPTRPPALKGINPATEVKLTEAWLIYQEKELSAELLTGFEGTDTGTTGNAFEDILNIVSVHPLREDTISGLLEQDKSDYSVIDTLIEQKLIEKTKFKGKTYYIRCFQY